MHCQFPLGLPWACVTQLFSLGPLRLLCLQPAILCHSEGRDTISGFSLPDWSSLKNLGLGQNGLAKFLPPYSSPEVLESPDVIRKSRDQGKDAKVASLAEAWGGAQQEKQQLQVLNTPRALWSLWTRIFPGCGELSSGLCRSLLYAKIMNNTEGQESEIYRVGTEMWST